MAIDDFSFGRDENVFTLRKKNLLGLAGFTGESKKFQVDGRRRWRWRRPSVGRVILVGICRCNRRRDLRLGHEDVPSRAFVLGIFAGLQPVIAQGGIERTRASDRLLGARLRTRRRSRRSSWPGSRNRNGRRRGCSCFRSRTSRIKQQDYAGSRHQPDGYNQFGPIFRPKFHLGSTRLQISFHFKLQLDHAALFSTQHYAVHQEKHLVALQRVNESY